MSGQRKAAGHPTLARVERAYCSGNDQRRDDRGCDRQTETVSGHTTTTTALLALSGPRQLAAAGVTVYCQEPAGTLLSVQVSRVIVPEQPFAA